MSASKELVLVAPAMCDLPHETLAWHAAFWSMIGLAAQDFDTLYQATRAHELIIDEVTGAHWIMCEGEATMADLGGVP